MAIKWHHKIPCLLGIHNFETKATFYWGNLYRTHLTCNRCKEDFSALHVNLSNGEHFNHIMKVDNDVRQMYKTLFDYKI